MIMDPELARLRFDRDASPLREHSSHYAAVGIRLVTCEYPTITVGLGWESQRSEILLRVEAVDWDYRPPKGWWITNDGSVLRPGTGKVPAGAGFHVNGDAFGENRPWFCFPGWYEFHDHQSHQQPTWASLRGKSEYGVLGRIVQLHADLNKPQVQAQ